MSRFDKARVAEVVVRRAGKAEYGSGYRISTRLVLTVGHLLDTGHGDDLTCNVLLGGGDREYPAAVMWRHARRDLAVLRIGSAGQGGPGDTVPPVVFGALPDDVGRVPFTGVGFPAFAQRPASADVQGLRRRDGPGRFRVRYCWARI